MKETRKRGEFIKVKCKDCGYEQVLFNKPSTAVVCLACGATLAKPVGKKADFRGAIVETCE